MTARRWPATVAAVLAVVLSAPSESRDAIQSLKLSEPAKLYSPEAAGQLAETLAKIARREANRGDMPAAIEAMQLAANEMAQRRNTNFELWDNLAELYCVQARRDRDPKRAAAARANGLALLREFRCAANFYKQNTPNACFMDGTTLPNTDMTPLCYSVMCTAAGHVVVAPKDDTLTGTERLIQESRSEPADTDYSYYHYYKEDATNLAAIEQSCRPPK